MGDRANAEMHGPGRCYPIHYQNGMAYFQPVYQDVPNYNNGAVYASAVPNQDPQYFQSYYPNSTYDSLPPPQQTMTQPVQYQQHYYPEQPQIANATGSFNPHQVPMNRMPTVAPYHFTNQPPTTYVQSQEAHPTHFHTANYPQHQQILQYDFHPASLPRDPQVTDQYQPAIHANMTNMPNPVQQTLSIYPQQYQNQVGQQNGSLAPVIVHVTAPVPNQCPPVEIAPRCSDFENVQRKTTEEQSNRDLPQQPVQNSSQQPVEQHIEQPSTFPKEVIDAETQVNFEDEKEQDKPESKNTGIQVSSMLETVGIQTDLTMTQLDAIENRSSCKVIVPNRSKQEDNIVANDNASKTPFGYSDALKKNLSSTPEIKICHTKSKPKIVEEHSDDSQHEVVSTKSCNYRYHNKKEKVNCISNERETSENRFKGFKRDSKDFLSQSNNISSDRMVTSAKKKHSPEAQENDQIKLRLHTTDKESESTDTAKKMAVPFASKTCEPEELIEMKLKKTDLVEEKSDVHSEKLLHESATNESDIAHVVNDKDQSKLIGTAKKSVETLELSNQNDAENVSEKINSENDETLAPTHAEGSHQELSKKALSKKKKQTKLSNKNNDEKKKKKIEESDLEVLKDLEEMRQFKNQFNWSTITKYVEKVSPARHAFLAFQTSGDRKTFDGLEEEIVSFLKDQCLVSITQNYSIFADDLFKRIESYGKSEQIDMIKLSHFCKEIANARDPVIVEDTVWLFSKQLQEEDQKILFQKYFTHILNIANSKSRPTKASPCRLADFDRPNIKIEKKYLLHFISYINRQFSARYITGSYKFETRQGIIEKYLFTRWYNSYDFQKREWSQSDTANWLNKKRLELMALQKSEEINVCIELLSFLETIKSSILDFDTYAYKTSSDNPDNLPHVVPIGHRGFLKALFGFIPNQS